MENIIFVLVIAIIFYFAAVQIYLDSKILTIIQKYPDLRDKYAVRKIIGFSTLLFDYSTFPTEIQEMIKKQRKNALFSIPFIIISFIMVYYFYIK